MPETLFPIDLPERQWLVYRADGFAHPVCGAIFRTRQPPCCGVPLGGIGTGCIDIEAKGMYGLSSLFNPSSPFQYVADSRMPRKLPDCQPILGLAVGGAAWVLASQDVVSGGTCLVCTDTLYDREPAYSIFERDPATNQDIVRCPRLEGARPASEIHYWGHYPVVDMEFETDAPVSVGMRGWSPFIPGDAGASNIPAAVFEVRLRNTSKDPLQGTLAFNFPGPNAQEARSTEFTRQPINEAFQGVLVNSGAGVQYALGVIGFERCRFGAGLNSAPDAWSKIATELAQPAFREVSGTQRFQDGSSSAAVDFALEPGEDKTVRFLLAWYAPEIEGARKTWEGRDRLANGHLRLRWIGSEWQSDAHFFTHMYAARYSNALDVARRVAAEHEALLKRVLAWQEAVYTDSSLPVWLRDSLVNNLALIAEDSCWFQPKPPLGDWAFPGGAFALNESPRGDPHIACIPCDWYGNLPIVFFFPDLARSNLRAFKAYQLPSGEIPFAIGRIFDLPDMATPEYYWQVSLNGVCYADLVDRLWQRTGCGGVLREFYDSVKRCTTFTMNLRAGPSGVISMPEIGGMEWFEHGEWAGMASHMGGLRLAQVRIVERMAQAMGDAAYAAQCRAWLADGRRAMEEEMWADGYYLNFWEKETGKRSDDVMAYQLDGEWTARYHGFDGVFRADRVKTALDTIRRCNVALTPEVGAANFARPDGSPLTRSARAGGEHDDGANVAWYGAYAMFPAEVLVLAMTYLYAGEVEFGVDLARRHWETLALRQRHAWDLPNIVRGDTGERVYGTDYYQDMMLWALPAAIAGQDIGASCAPGHLIDRVIRAGRGDLR